MSNPTILGVPLASMVPAVAAHLAHMSSEDQAAFFRVFADELASACGTKWGRNMQGASIRLLLTKEQREVYDMIGHEEGAS